MIIDTGIMTLDVSIVDYIEKVVDAEQGFGVKIVFLPEFKKVNRFVYFGKVKEYRMGEYIDSNKMKKTSGAYSIINSDGSATVHTQAFFLNANHNLDSISFSQSDFNEFFLNPMNLQTDFVKREQFYDKIFKAMTDEGTKSN